MHFYQKINFLIGDKIKKIYLFIFLYILSASLDLVSIALIFPFFASFGNSNIDYEYKTFFESINLNTDFTIVYLILILILFILKAALSIGILNKLHKFCDNVQLLVAKKLFTAFQNIDYIEYAKTNKSIYVDSLGKWPGHLSQRYLMILIKLIGESIISFFMICVMLLINWKMTIIVLSCILFFVLIFDRIFKKNTIFYARGSNYHSVNRTKVIQESLGNLKGMKVYQLENFFLSLMSHHIKSDLSLIRKVNLINFLPRYSFEIIAIFFFLLFVYFASSTGIAIESILPYLTAIGIAAIRLKPFGELLATGLVRLRTSKDSIDRIYYYVSKFSDIEKKTYENLFFNEIDNISLKNIEFNFLKNKKILNNINLKLERGEITGITGSSGSGKSTLIDIITGFLKPSKGQIKLNNIDITDNIFLLRNFSSYNTQDIFLLDASLEENIAIGQAQNETDSVKILEIINLLSLKDVAERVKSQLKEKQSLSQRINLSGGEKQRVAIARAIYFDRKILIFDESTNALDSDNTEKILDYLNKIKQNKVILIVSHQKEVLSRCDKIYNLYKGKVLS